MFTYLANWKSIFIKSKSIYRICNYGELSLIHDLTFSTLPTRLKIGINFKVIWSQWYYNLITLNTTLLDPHTRDLHPE